MRVKLDRVCIGGSADSSRTHAHHIYSIQLPNMAAEVEGQFAGVEAVLQQSDTRAFADGVELGNGLLSVEER